MAEIVEEMTTVSDFEHMTLAEMREYALQKGAAKKGVNYATSKSELLQQIQQVERKQSQSEPSLSTVIKPDTSQAHSTGIDSDGLTQVEQAPPDSPSVVMFSSSTKFEDGQHMEREKSTSSGDASGHDAGGHGAGGDVANLSTESEQM